MIAAAFTLGFTFAPVNYLSASTWTMTHVPRTFMPTASAIVDLGGYVGTIVLLQLQSSSGVEESEKTLFLMRLLSVSASCCCLFLVGRFALEELRGAGRHPHGEEKKDA